MSVTTNTTVSGYQNATDCHWCGNTVPHHGGCAYFCESLTVRANGLDDRDNWAVVRWRHPTPRSLIPSESTSVFTTSNSTMVASPTHTPVTTPLTQQTPMPSTTDIILFSGREFSSQQQTSVGVIPPTSPINATDSEDFPRDFWVFEQIGHKGCWQKVCDYRSVYQGGNYRELENLQIEYPTGRMGHTMIALDEGILIYGGVSKLATYYHDLWLVTPSLGNPGNGNGLSCRQLLLTKYDSASPDTGIDRRCGHSMTQVTPNSLILFGGLSEDRSMLNDMWLITVVYPNAFYKQIEPTAVGPGGRKYHVSCYYDNWFYVFGGKSDSLTDTQADLIWRCKIEISDIISETAIVGSSLRNNTLAAPPSDLHVHSNSNTTTTNVTPTYSINSRDSQYMTTLGTGPGQRYGHGGVVHGGRWIIIGGQYKNQLMNDLFEFCFMNRTWTEVIPLGDPLPSLYCPSPIYIPNTETSRFPHPVNIPPPAAALLQEERQLLSPVTNQKAYSSGVILIVANPDGKRTPQVTRLVCQTLPWICPDPVDAVRSIVDELMNSRRDVSEYKEKLATALMQVQRLKTKCEELEEDLTDLIKLRSNPVAANVVRNLLKHLTEQQTDGRCVICQDNSAQVAMTPCGHVCCCQSCAINLGAHECPMCRSHVSGTLRVHMT